MPADDERESLRRYLQRLEQNIQAVRRRLKRFEDEFGMDSEAFYARLHSAEPEDRLEHAEWAGEHEVLKRLEQQRDEVRRKLGE